MAWLSYSVFTLYAGSKGVVITDTLMFLLFTGASLFFVTHLLGLVSEASHSTIQDLTRLSAKPDLTSWHGIIGEGTPLAYGARLFYLVCIDRPFLEPRLCR